jgi:hypothetical protein
MPRSIHCANYILTPSPDQRVRLARLSAGRTRRMSLREAGLSTARCASGTDNGVRPYVGRGLSVDRWTAETAVSTCSVALPTIPWW